MSVSSRLNPCPILRASCVLAAILAPLLLAGPAVAAAGTEEEVDYLTQVRPILARSCFACHGQDEEQRAKGLRIDLREFATKEQRESGAQAIVPGDPDASEIVARITEEDVSLRMPPKKAGEPLSAEEVDLIKRWIAQGAPYAEHWAFLPPAERPLPSLRGEGRAWPRNGIDSWILDRLEREGLAPSPEADRFTLLRRVSLDLRGLPPTPREIETFADDPSPDAYERAVDRFLADPAYGERWARMWLDLARYADSAGFGSDPLRPNAWRYRDWVIDAFNRNMPYDRFTVNQIAGDLLPEPTLETRMATAFHRNTMTNTEGGTDDEEFRVAAIKDRADTTAQVWMGLTMGCAKCHTHKYDPITHEDYYRFYAFFNQTADADLPDETPVIPAPTPYQQEQNRRIDEQVARLKATLDVTTPEIASAQERWEAELGKRPEWVTLEPVSTRSGSGATFESLPDGSIRVGGPNPDRETYTIAARTSLRGLTAIRLEAIPDPTLPGGGSGRAADGNFVLSQIRVEATPSQGEALAPTARYVRVELPGEGKILSLAEVEVTSGGENVARAGAAEQSSTDYAGEASRAIDGNTDGRYFDANSTTHTRLEANPWWQVKLASARPVDKIVLWNRSDQGLDIRLAGARVQLLDDARKVVWQAEVPEAPSPKRELPTDDRKPVAIATASADFSQDKFAVAGVLAPKVDPAKGWAVGPKQKEPHEAVFALKEPLDLASTGGLTIRLEHAYKDPGHALGRFRLSVTSDPSAVRRAQVPASVLAILDTPPDGRSAEGREALARHYRSIAPALQPVRDEIARLEKARPEIPTLPVMVELPPDKRRTTHLMLKGNHITPGKQVEPGVPAAFHPLPEGAPSDRLGLARWLVDPANPLTARVAVNRLWSQVFGVGLVETEEDFGTQGDLPSHPELLDWLAREYVRTGWDTKALVRTIVTSATYRQSSRATPALLEKDPRNRLLARAPRYRLEAEMVRDQALALSGLLSHEVGGPSVFPPQPEGLWQAAFNGQRTWTTSKGDGPPSPRAVHLLATDRPLSVHVHVRCAEPRALRGPSGADQYPAPGARHPE